MTANIETEQLHVLLCSDKTDSIAQ